MKVTIFQKQLGESISKDTTIKLGKEKSDFLLLPQRLFLNPNEDDLESWRSYNSYLNQILDLSFYYRGVILGGSLFRQHNGPVFESVPLVQDMSLIDHYDLKSSLSSDISYSDSETAFIMAGVRFSVLVGIDIYNQDYLDEIEGKGINIIFCLDSESTKRAYEEDLDFFSELSKKRNFNIFRVCGHNQIANIRGRSLISTPTGIQWKVGKNEEYSDIIKTIHLAQSNPFL